MTIPQAFELALQHHQSGRLAEAEALYRQILAVEPRHAEALHHLGVIAHQVGRNDVAVELIRQAIALQPNYPEAHSNLGNALKDKGQLGEAIAACRQAIVLQPNLSAAHANLGIALHDKGQLDEAIAACRQAIALQPNYPEAHANLGVALHDKGQLGEAIAAFRQAVALKPNYPEAHSNLGVTLRDKGQFDEAIAACRQGIALKPNLPGAHNNLGVARHDKAQLDEAIAAWRQALALKPNYPEAHYNLGVARHDKGQLDEAIAAYRQAIALKPNYPRAHSNIAHALLVQGDFLQGWEEYEWRWKVKDATSPQRNFTQPQWDGSPLGGRTLLLHAEQGLGDTLQFVRYAPLVTQSGGRVIVECQPELKTLLESAGGLWHIIARGEPWPAFDWHCPLMSLPRAFRTRVETIPSTPRYLHADAQKAARWRERLEQHHDPADGPASAQRRTLKVGLVWAGEARLHQPDANRIDRRRSILLRQVAPLAEVPGVVFVSLQKGAPATQAQTPPEGLTLLDWTEELADFADTATLVEALDLVISVDTAVAHLAGALGRPVWMLNRFDTCWRWLLDRSDSPWYPTMRLFRQPSAGDWDSVIAEVRGQLQLLVQLRSAKP